MVEPKAAQPNTLVKNAFVIGWPIKHSRSPLLHGHWIKTHGISGTYKAVPCEPHNLRDFLGSMAQKNFVGGNITLPHKEQAVELVDIVHDTARELEAVNTVWLDENGKLHGDNTDEYGFLANMDEQAPGWNSSENKKQGALVLGAGGASRAIIHGLISRGFDQILIANRTLSRAEMLAEKFGDRCQAIAIDELPAKAFLCSVIVNTTSVGMGDGKSPIELDDFAKDIVVNDIVYAPLTTPLLARANQRGMRTVDGLGMLLHQAVPGFEKWFGLRPNVTEDLRNLLLKDLGENT